MKSEIVSSKYTTLTSNTIIFAVANIGSKAINFLLVPLYTNILSTSEYGTAELILNFTNILIPFLSLSISDAVLRFGIDKNNKENDVLKSSCLILLFGSVIGLLLTPVYRKYDAIGPWAIYFSLICISQMIRGTLSIFSKAIQKTKLFAIDTILYTLFLATSNVALLAGLRLGVQGYLLSYIVANAASILFLLIAGGYVAKLKAGVIDFALLKAMLRYSTPLIINALSWWFINFIDRVMLQEFMSSAEVGIYTAASKIPTILATIMSVFIQAWTLSSIMEYDGERSKSFYSNVFKVYSSFLFLLTMVILYSEKYVMSFYVGNDYFEAWKYVPLLTVSSTFLALSSFVSPFYSAEKRNIAVSITTIIASIVNIIGNFFFIQIMGIIGAVIATTIAHFILFIVRFYHTRTFFKFDVEMGSFWVSILVLVMSSIVVTYNYHVSLFFILCSLCLLGLNFNNLVSIVSRIISKVKKTK